MTRTAILVDSAVFILAVIVLVTSLRSFRNGKRLVGQVRAQWSVRFHWANPWAWVRLALLLGLLGTAVALALAGPRSIDPFWPIALVCLVLAFFPRNSFVVVGSEGLLDRSVFLPWTSVREKRVIEDNGRKFLVIEMEPGPASTAYGKKRTIRVPENVSLVLP